MFSPFVAGYLLLVAGYWLTVVSNSFSFNKQLETRNQQLF